MSPSLVPSSDQDHDLHFVLCDFGKYGKTYIETTNLIGARLSAI